jgi:mevalonate kinase
MVQNNPVVMGALQKNILERISLMAQEQIQMEFREEIQQAQQMQQMLQQQPQNQQLIQEAQQLTNIVNARKAVLIAEMTKDYMDEEEKITGGFGGDPLIKLKAREVDLKSQENKRKKDEGQERINIDKMKAMMNQSQHEDKLEQNEDLAEMRADTSLTKQIMADESKRNDFGRNFRKR